ncbi:MAG: class I SAM-dependent methyltransferase [Chloroflexi bacterium]|nr:class I SAM-dependent methyltransferase [Chloroflexota bacterium]
MPIFSHSIQNPTPCPDSPDLETVVCDCCGGSRTLPLAVLPPVDELALPMHRLGAAALRFQTGAVRFCRCQDCGLVYMNPRLTENAVARFYDTVYAVKGAAPAFESDQARRTNLYLDRIAALLAVPQPHVLDIGCGAGQFLHLAQARGWTVSGSELSGVAAEKAGRLLGVPVYHGDFREMGFAPASLDVITLLSVLEHLRAPMDTLRDSAALLKPGGVLMFNVPNPDSWEYRLSRLTGQRWRGFIIEHLYYFTPAFLRRCLTELGLDIRVMSSWNPDSRLPNPLRDLRAARAAAPAPATSVPMIPAARPVSLPRRLLRQANHYLLDAVSALSEGRQGGGSVSGNALFVWAQKRG